VAVYRTEVFCSSDPLHLACCLMCARECLVLCVCFCCRFPIQLELLEPAEAVALIPAPEEYDVPANVGWCHEQGWDIKKVQGCSTFVECS
jgi:hypothetical protein